MKLNRPSVVMLAGSLIWLAGELTGVYNDAHGYHGPPETTSGWVWLLERKHRPFRMVVAASLAALAVHFLDGQD